MWKVRVAHATSNPVPASLSTRYSVGRQLGHGGMSTVYEATDLLLKRQVAIKVFTARADSEEDIERQEAEAKLIASLNHPALTTLHDAGVDATDRDHPQIFLVMEYIPGDDLRERLRQGPLTPFQVCWLGWDLCEGLEYVHAHGFLHRDIKPANVLLASRNAETRLRGKLTDFGIASLLRIPDVGQEVRGTAAYLSPEQAEGRQLTRASDLYSLGLVLLEALTGRLAFPGGVEESALARLDRDPAISGLVPEEFAVLLRSMTSRRPQDRISAAAAAAAFQNLLINELMRQRTTAAPDSMEARRLAALLRYNILDFPPEASFARATRLASRFLDIPIALVTITGVHRVWFVRDEEMAPPPLDWHTALCAATDPGTGHPWAVPDTAEDARTRTNPLVVEHPRVRAYAAAPLSTYDGHRLGALCVFDRRPRRFTPAELETLQDLADVVMNEMELRLAGRRALFRT
jgi:GAF domain-containing protein/tRNA A-37 threonylcarbamoyl transferase component Bud32